jgi:hypothetical protein
VNTAPDYVGLAADPSRRLVTAFQGPQQNFGRVNVMCRYREFLKSATSSTTDQQKMSTSVAVGATRREAM